MNSPVEQIKGRLSIEDVVSSYINLIRAGSNWKAKCPFHNEKTPSFFISPSRGTYYCFGCGASGDIFSFVEEFEGLDFKGALKMLANRAGVELGTYSKTDNNEKDRIFQIMEIATKHFINNLEAHKDAIQYLTSRGLEDKTIKSFRLGFAKDSWRDLYDFLRGKDFSDGDMEKAGLAKKTDKGFYDRFRNRIIFPIFDSSGRVIAFSGRLFQDDSKSAKYLNSTDTPIFNKSAVLYGLNYAKDSIRKNNFSILVEGQIDLVLAHQTIFKNTIATSGTALSDSTVSKENVVSNLGLVRRLSNNIVLAFDGDKAGISATERAGKIALSLGMDVKVALLPEGMDPADLISQKGAEAWKLAIKNAKHVIEFVLDKILQKFSNDDRKVGREVREKVLPYVETLPSSIEKIHFLKKISDLTSIPVGALEEDLRKIASKGEMDSREIREIASKEEALRRKDFIERKLLGIVFWQESLNGGQDQATEILEKISAILDVPSQEIIKKFEANKEDLIFEAEVFYKDADFKKDGEELLLNLKEESLKEMIGTKMRELHALEEGQDKDKPAHILNEINDINKQIHDIKNSRIKK